MIVVVVDSNDGVVEANHSERTRMLQWLRCGNKCTKTAISIRTATVTGTGTDSDIPVEYYV